MPRHTTTQERLIRFLLGMVLYILTCEPVSSVSIVSGYWLDDREIEFRSPADAKELFL
jgi:hypothetical protein